MPRALGRARLRRSRRLGVALGYRAVGTAGEEGTRFARKLHRPAAPNGSSVASS